MAGIPDPAELSDGFHTFAELYEHRNALTAALYAVVDPESRWKTRQHGDGSMFPGFFLVCLELPEGSVTYHVPEGLWDAFGGPELEQAPPYDGHTPADVVARLTAYARRCS